MNTHPSHLGSGDVRHSTHLGSCLWLLGWLLSVACSSPGGSEGGTGGALGGGAAAPSGGASSGGVSSGGATTADGGSGGLSSSGGAVGDGGAATGGAGSGGLASTGGSGGASGGSPGNFEPPFILGADISSVQESTVPFVDTDGQTKSIFALLRNHGFNYVRLRTFVDPSAPYGYASSANGCTGKAEAFGDKLHVIEYGKQVKQAGMGLLIDFHYSDVWADPGNQIIPAAWRSAGSISELAALQKAYTKDFIESAIAAGARPDMVQIGNEITPGMMAHVPGPNTDCWGNQPQSAPFGGTASNQNWDNLATLLKAGIEGVREVDPAIQIMLHVENTDDLDGVKWWLDSALARGVELDVFGMSCYTAFQGQPSVWQATFTNLAQSYPDLKFVIAEYNPERTQANQIMKNLPNGRGLGTFFWEPSLGGEWGSSMFTWQNGSQVANSADFAEFDALLPSLGL